LPNLTWNDRLFENGICCSVFIDNGIGQGQNIHCNLTVIFGLAGSVYLDRLVRFVSIFCLDSLFKSNKLNWPLRAQGFIIQASLQSKIVDEQFPG